MLFPWTRHEIQRTPVSCWTIPLSHHFSLPGYCLKSWELGVLLLSPTRTTKKEKKKSYFFLAFRKKEKEKGRGGCCLVSFNLYISRWETAWATHCMFVILKLGYCLKSKGIAKVSSLMIIHLWTIMSAMAWTFGRLQLSRQDTPPLLVTIKLSGLPQTDDWQLPVLVRSRR